jgi:protein-tyrosine phosphatase
MAEGLLKHALIVSDKGDCTVSSAGLGALVGHPPDPKACQLMMETAHKIAIEESEPSAKGKVFRLGEWGKFDIPDPYKQDLSAFIQSINLIEQGIALWVPKL